MSFLKNIQELHSKNQKAWAALIDPDKWKSSSKFIQYIKDINELQPDFIFLGGSTVEADDFKNAAYLIKAYSSIPLVIFPGSSLQISNDADALLFLSLISGRNPDYLIHHQVLAAPKLASSDLEVVPTSYMLIDGGNKSSVAYVSQTTPIPRDQITISEHTALAGKFLGHQVTYLDAGSGAKYAVPNKIINAIHNKVEHPIIVGGGIKTKQDIIEKYNAGATVVVVGNALESKRNDLRNALLKDKV